MRRSIYPIVAVLAAVTTALVVVAQHAPGIAAQRPQPAESMATAARAFLGTLSAEQRQQATFPFDSPQRMDWHYIPRERKGLPLKAMTGPQQAAALDLLRASLSQQGYDTAATIRRLETVLRAKEQGRGPLRDPENYAFTVFGEPSETGTWGWRYEGHHCSQNFTIAHGKAVASSPQFFGANPADVRDGPMKGTRALAGREDLARDLVKALNEAQRKQAILAEKAPADIITGAARQVAIQENRGLPASELSSEQRRTLIALLHQYTDPMPKPLADQRLAAVRKDGPGNVKFAWMGGTEKGQGHYYRIQGASFMVEYDCTQDGANHIHSVWRDFKGDWGLDLLAMHYRQYHVASAR